MSGLRLVLTVLGEALLIGAVWALVLFVLAMVVPGGGW